MRTNIPNIHSKEGFSNEKVKLNGFTSMFLLFSVFMMALFMMQDDNIELYEHVSIEHGDTLWSLAEQYRGKMAKHDWINEVKKKTRCWMKKLY